MQITSRREFIAGGAAATTAVASSLSGGQNPSVQTAAEMARIEAEIVSELTQMAKQRDAYCKANGIDPWYIGGDDV